ncbi:MAG: peptidoglycan-binding protein [Candidatus Colwellbacteria bacterium]|nr:peptidoglycan-binding protein [Candidatus Colwellbacteria bacterium]
MRRISLSLFIAILLLNGPVVHGAASTTVDLQAQITALLQQVQALQARLQAGSSTQEAVVLNNNLRRGSTDATTNGEVTKLQQFLAADKTIYPEGLVTGYFGSLTEAAVKRWQTKSGIQAVGVAGPITREAIKQATVVVAPAPVPSPAGGSTAPTSTPPVSPPPATPSLGSIILSPSSGQVGETLTITG